uniref:EamA-like transporter family n=1 Tax=Mimiviridae sp. ChoanoV1 TaxID=2596887 RepID=A0A5B8IHZ5_9VIRU|nr:EamA-like transporter family [Mimiviridae sp. ChoanoV1]
MDVVIFSLISVIFLWSLMFVFYKKISNFTDYKTLVILKIIFLSIFGLIGTIIYLLFNKEKYHQVIQTDKNIVKLIMIASFVELLTTFFYVFLLYKKEANWLIAILEAGIIVTTLFLSLILLNEKVNMDRILGLIILISGIIIVYKS